MGGGGPRPSGACYVDRGTPVLSVFPEPPSPFIAIYCSSGPSSLSATTAANKARNPFGASLC